MGAMMKIETQLHICNGPKTVRHGTDNSARCRPTIDDNSGALGPRLSV